VTTTQERRDTDVDLDTRDIRALTEAVIVLPPRLAPPEADVGPGMYYVQTDAEWYVVEPGLEACTCSDAKYRSPEGGCKHVRRVRFETGERDLPSWIETDGLGHGFRMFVDES